MRFILAFLEKLSATAPIYALIILISGATVGPAILYLGIRWLFG